MSNQSLKRLFTPGAGVVPPYLAGRKGEQEYFQDCVEGLKTRNPISQDLILYGPRGNGKTALLGYLQKETLRKEGSKLDIQWATPGRMETPTEFDNTLAGVKRFRDTFKKLIASVGYQSVSAGIELDLSGSARIAEDQIRKKCKKKPFILIIDEAHTLKPEVGNSLLNASQTVRREGHPFLLVLAGTPNLMAALGKSNASFWGRSKILPLGRLSPEEAGQAVTVPLEQVGISFAPGVIDEIAGRTHCYPYFLQIWGDRIARRLDQTGQTEVTPKTLREVEAEAHRERDTMYETRFDEIERMGLLPVANSVANAFIQPGSSTLHGSVLEDAIAKGMAGADEPVTDGRVLERLEQLSHLGYVWKTGGYDYEPGIPSLMTYVQGYSRVQGNAPDEPSPLKERIQKLRKDLANEPDTGIEM